MALTYTVSVHSNGRIWPQHSGGLKEGVCVLNLPQQSASAGAPRTTSNFTTLAYDDKAEHLAGVDSLGHVFCFNLRSNRVCKLETAGVGTGHSRPQLN